MGRPSLPQWASALRAQEFRRLLGIIAAQNIGFWFIFPGLQLTIATRTGNDPLALGLLFFITMLPILLFSLHAGAALDRRDRIVVLNIGQGLVVLTALATAASVWWQSSPLWLIFLCSAFIGLSFAITLPAQQSLLINSVDSGNTASAVSLNSMVMNVARTLGPGLAAVLIAVINVPGSILFYGVAGLVGIALSRTLTLPRFAASSQSKSNESTTHEVGIRAGIRHARSRPPTATMLIVVAVASLFGMSFVTQTPVIAAQASSEPQAFLLLVSAGGLGSLVGIVLVARNVGGLANVGVAASLLGFLGLMVVALGWSHVLVLSIVIAAVAGALQFAVTTIANVVVQTRADDAYRGRISSLFNIAWGGLVPIGGLTLGALVAVLGIGWGMTVSGGVTLVCALVIVGGSLLRRKNELR